MSSFHTLFMFFPFLYLLFVILVIYYVVTWVNKFIRLKQEHNQLLREILQKMGKNQNNPL